MSIYAITIAFSPASQLARCLFEYLESRSISPERHIIAQGHYPINTAKNNRDIKMIVDSYGDAELWDPGSNLGSAQTQNWVLAKLGVKDDWVINLDPDSNCRQKGWDQAMASVLKAEPDCVAISCFSPLIERFIKDRNIELEYRQTGTITYAFANKPIPFNLSMLRTSFLNDIGGIPQMGEHWGETEAPFHAYCQQRGKFQAILMDYIEDESGKYMQDSQLLEYKNLHMRSKPEDRFSGIYEEYLRYKHKDLLSTNTFIPDNTTFL